MTTTVQPQTTIFITGTYDLVFFNVIFFNVNVCVYNIHFNAYTVEMSLSCDKSEMRTIHSWFGWKGVSNENLFSSFMHCW